MRMAIFTILFVLSILAHSEKKEDAIVVDEKPIVIASNTKKESAPKGYEHWKTVTAKVTAYDPSHRCCGIYADGKTSINKSAWKMNGCAADPKVIPYGSMVYIPGVGVRTVDDTGSAMRASTRRGVYHIDVRFKYYYQAKRFGVKWLKVRIYRRIRNGVSKKEG